MPTSIILFHQNGSAALSVYLVGIVGKCLQPAVDQQPNISRSGFFQFQVTLFSLISHKIRVCGNSLTVNLYCPLSLFFFLSSELSKPIELRLVIYHAICAPPLHARSSRLHLAFALETMCVVSRVEYDYGRIQYRRCYRLSR